MCYCPPRVPFHFQFQFHFFHFASTTSSCQVTAMCRQVHRMTPKWQILQSQRFPIYVLLVSLRHQCQSVALYGQAFLSYRPFCEKSALYEPPNDLEVEPYKVTNVPQYMCYYSPRVPNFTPFRSTRRFRDTSHFETSALNDPQITLNPTRLNVPHMYY